MIGLRVEAGPAKVAEELWAGIEWSGVSRVAAALARRPNLAELRDAQRMTPMLFAISRAQSERGLEIAKMIFEEVGHFGDEDAQGWGAAEWAVNGGSLALEWLMEHGVPLDLPSKDRGMTPFLLAVELGQSECATWLAQRAGANKSALGADGLGAMHIAAQEGHVPMGKALVELGVDIDAPDCSGRTPLIIALKNANLRFGRWLLDRQADVGPRSSDGLSALDWAERSAMAREVLGPIIAARARAQEERRELSLLIDPAAESPERSWL